MELLQQYAALPLLHIDGEPHVLLITSRGSGRWVVPKGWPKSDYAPHEIAAREARQEAGITGTIEQQAFGSYSYTKRLHLLSWVRCNVRCFVLHAERQRRDWPERRMRQLEWLPITEAAARVRERELAGLLRSLAGHSWTG